MSNCVTATMKNGVRMPASSLEQLSGALGCRNAAVRLQCAVMGEFLLALDSQSTPKRVVAGEVAA